MKIIAQLPPEIYYQLVGKTDPNKWVWEDRDTPAVKVIADSKDPWSKLQGLAIGVQTQKSDNYEWTYRYVIRCFENPQPAPQGVIEREIMRGWAIRSPILNDGSYPDFTVLPTEKRKIFITYSVWKK